MTLRNAFEELGLESTLRKILAAVTYARTPSDQMRVVTDAGSVVTVSNGSTVYNNNLSSSMNAGTAVAYWGPGTWNGMDAREPAREAAEQHFVLTRNRWTIT